MKELNKEVKNYAEKELCEAISWRGNSLQQIFDFKDDILGTEEKLENKVFLAISKFKDYPNHIVGGKSWTEISRGVIANVEIQRQIEHFYNDRYQEYLELLKSKGEYTTESPVWLVVKERELNPNTVYPTIAKHKGENLIVLLINIE